MDTLLRTGSSLSPRPGVDLPNVMVSDVEWADDVMLLVEDPDVLHNLLCSAYEFVSMFVMCFQSLNSKMIPKDWLDATLNLLTRT